MSARLALALLALCVLPARAGRTEEAGEAPVAPATFFPLADVRPGMKGYALTVTHGTEIERFDVEVVDVMRNKFAQLDIILVRCSGGEIADTRIAQGMSGSPVFLDDRVVGAIAYTWGWSTEALAGVTPIEPLVAEGSRPFEGRPSGVEPPTQRGWRPVPPARGGSTDPDPSALRPISTPVSVAGFSPHGRDRLARSLGELGLGLQTVDGGSVAGAPGPWVDRDAPLVPGCALAVELARGDFSVAAIGTCTWIDGDKIYGFGHPFQGMGETLYPLSVGYVYDVVANQNVSFKLGAALREVGALVQDRQPGIVGIVGRTAPMVPFEVTMRNAVTGHEEVFSFEITANRIMFTRLMYDLLRETFASSEQTLGYNTKHYEMSVKLHQADEPWTHEDTIVAFDPGLSRLLMGLVDRVTIHPSQRATFEWVKLDVEIENVDRRAFVRTVTASRDEARPGETVTLAVRLERREDGEDVLEHLEVVIPETVPDGNLVITVTSGGFVGADVASPVDIADIQELYDSFLKSTELVAVVPTGRVDLDLGGRLIRDLPLSAVPRLARSLEGRGAQVRTVAERIRKELPYVIDGSAQVVIRIHR